MLLVALMAVAAFVAGCGGDDEAEGVTTSSLSKAEHVEQANKICAKHNSKASRELNAELSSAKQPEEIDLAAITSLMTQNAQAQHDEIQDLGAPEGSEDEVEEVLVAMQQSLDETEEKDIETPEKFYEEFDQYDKLALKYGLDACIFSS